VPTGTRVKRCTSVGALYALALMLKPSLREVAHIFFLGKLISIVKYQMALLFSFICGPTCFSIVIFYSKTQVPVYSEGSTSFHNVKSKTH
jgi:hypothetical protein